MNAIDIADEIFRELDSPEDTSVSAILFWLTSNIGKLNTLLDIDILVTVADEFEPELLEDQKVIFKKLYEIHYFQRQTRKNLGAAAFVSVIELKEGDRQVKRTNKTDIAKTYKALVLDLNEELNQLITLYKINRSGPEQFFVPNPIHEEDESSSNLGVRGFSVLDYTRAI